MLLDRHHQELTKIEADKGAYGARIWLEEVKVVVEAAGVKGWEQVVQRLDQSETETIMELPTWMREDVSEYLRHPKETKNCNRVDILRHYARTESDQGESY